MGEVPCRSDEPIPNIQDTYKPCSWRSKINNFRLRCLSESRHFSSFSGGNVRWSSTSRCTTREFALLGTLISYLAIRQMNIFPVENMFFHYFENLFRSLPRLKFISQANEPRKRVLPGLAACIKWIRLRQRSGFPAEHVKLLLDGP